MLEIIFIEKDDSQWKDRGQTHGTPFVHALIVVLCGIYMDLTTHLRKLEGGDHELEGGDHELEGGVNPCQVEYVYNSRDSHVRRTG